MGELSILQKIKALIGAISFKIFLWSIETTQEDYWYSIYLQEHAFYTRGD